MSQQITHVRSFNGSSDKIELASTDLQSGFTNLTVLALAKHDGATGFHWIWSISSTGSASEFSLGKRSTDEVALWSQDDAASGATSFTTDSFWTSAMGWCLIAATKADGASTVRLHRYRFDTQSWSHENGVSGKDVNAPGATAQVWLGSYDGASEWFDGDIAATAVWKTTALSDGQLEALISGNRIAESAIRALGPAGLWVLDQESTSEAVIDRVGAGDQVAVTGTTVVADSTLPFDIASTYERVVLEDGPVAYYRMDEGVLASDDFNRADEAPLGAPWADPGIGGIDLISNRVSVPVMDSANRGFYYSGPTWPADQFSKAKLYCVSTGGVRQGPALYVRIADGDNYYRFSTDHAASNNCNISKFVGGSRTTVVDFTQAWNDGDEWELRVEGPANAARLRTFLNGVQKSDTTDNSTIASGSPGIGVSGNATITSWSIDDWSGGSTLPRDSSGNGNHTTAVAGTPAYQDPGAISTDPSSFSIELDTARFSAPDHTTLDVGDVFTLEAWVKRDALSSGTARGILSKGNNSFFWYFDGTDHLYLDRQGVANIVQSTTTISDTTTWHHCVCTKNGATVKLYIDGVDVTGTVTNSTFTNTTVALFIGARDDDNFHVQANLDEVAVYPTALSHSQVRSHYEAGISAYAAAVLSDSPVAYYRMDEGTMVTDDFNRANEDPLAGNWATAFSNNALKIVSNAVTSTIDGGANNDMALYTGAVFPDDQFASAKLNVVSTDGVRRGPGLSLRYATGANTGYRFSTDHASTNNVNISRVLAGTRTTLVDLTQAWTDGDTWTFSVEGPAAAAHLRLLLNGTLIQEYTDNSSIASGYPGIFFGDNISVTSWSADDFSAGSLLLQDSSGNGNHTTASNGTPDYEQPGAIASDLSSTSIQCVRASAEYFTAPDHTTLDLGDTFSLEAWVRYSALAPSFTGYVVSKGAGAYAMAMQVNSDSTSMRLEIVRPTVAVIASSEYITADLNWHHIVVTKTGATVKQYIDGVDVTGTVTNSTCANNTETLFISERISGGANYFDGYIDEVAVYPTALTATQVLEHYEVALETGAIAGVIQFLSWLK